MELVIQTLGYQITNQIMHINIITVLKHFQKIGLPSEIYTHKPVHESNFKYSIETDDLKEPQNIIEVIRSLFNRVGKLFTYNKDEVTNFSENNVN